MKLANADHWLHGHDLRASQVDYLLAPHSSHQIDFLGNFENLNISCRLLALELNLPDFLPLPHIFKSPSMDYREAYDDESAEAIRVKYQRDFLLLDYDTRIHGRTHSVRNSGPLKIPARIDDQPTT
jgi:hypothetical protein